jgi:hypothetical protein
MARMHLRQPQHVTRYESCKPIAASKEFLEAPNALKTCTLWEPTILKATNVPRHFGASPKYRGKETTALLTGAVVDKLVGGSHGSQRMRAGDDLLIKRVGVEVTKVDIGHDDAQSNSDKTSRGLHAY